MAGIMVKKILLAVFVIVSINAAAQLFTVDNNGNPVYFIDASGNCGFQFVEADSIILDIDDNIYLQDDFNLEGQNTNYINIYNQTYYLKNEETEVI